jgi:hypothetical protein
MKIRRSILELLPMLAVTLLAVSPAWGESVHMRMRTQTFENAAVYSSPVEDAELAREGWLKQSDASVDVSVEMCMRATDMPEQKTQQRVRSQDVPGKADQRGYSRARLRQIGGRVELLIESLEVKDEPVKDAQGKDTGKKEEKKKAEQYSIALDFVSKKVSWRDYEEGKTVEFRFTKEAVKSTMARMKLEAGNSASVQASGDGNASVAIQVSPTKVPGRKASEFGRVVASKNRIDVIHIPTDVLIVMKMSS